MKDWQMRVVDEYEDLRVKRMALAAALSTKRETLDPAQVLLMECQFSSMTDYELDLRKRIEAF